MKNNSTIVEVRRADDIGGQETKAEVDEMQSFVKKKAYTRWLWHAIDHRTGEVLAYVLARRTDKAFLKLKKLLKPFGITKFYTDNLNTYQRNIPSQDHQLGYN